MKRVKLVRVVALVLLQLLIVSEGLGHRSHGQTPNGAPVPLLSPGHPVDWWFVFKFNSKVFPGCGGAAVRACPFGGGVRNYKGGFSQQFVYASSDHPTLEQGQGCVGDSTADPVGATFAEVYQGASHYVVWNDQFYDDPPTNGCNDQCGGPWGHSKGLVAWDDEGQGFVMQVTTPSWPGSGSHEFPRKKDGNTLGCVIDDDVKVSQHFFALRLNKGDLVMVLKALANASVATDPANPQIVNMGGPEEIQALVKKLGAKSDSVNPTEELLSSHVTLISKPSKLHVPPWQMVSALLGGVPLRTATWWMKPQIYTTTASSEIDCWSASLPRPGAVQIATTGQWNGLVFGLKGGSGPDFNHAKIGVSLSGQGSYAIFGDMNQQGTASGPNCASSQNGRGGLFYVVDNADLSMSIRDLIRGQTAATGPNE